MRLPFRLPARIWILIPLCALGFLAWAGGQRARRAEYVSNTDREAAAVDAASPTGYVDGKRWWIVPEHNNRSYQWIAETQQMLARHEWRVRHVDYENAPFGREVHSASLYRWWLGLIAWCDHAISGRPPGLSVERAALWADPLLHLILLLGTAIFVTRQFGTFPAILLSLGIALLYPFAAGFIPGVPDDRSLARCCALWSVLPLLAAMRIETSTTQRRAQRLFFAAGVAGGVGLWLGAAHQAIVLASVALGGFLAAWVARNQTKTGPTHAGSPALRWLAPWRTWALGGATTCLTVYCIEYFPARMDFVPQVNHPLYGLAWIGAGELLAHAESWSTSGKFSWNFRRVIGLLLAIAAVTALPVAMARSGTSTWLGADQLASRLTFLPNGVAAKNSAAWIARDGLTGAVSATCLPLLLLVPALWLLVRRRTPVGQRFAIAVALGPVVVSLLLAIRQLAWWNLLDAMLLALVVAVATEWPATIRSARSRWLWSGVAGLGFLAGMIQLLPLPAGGENFAFTRLEVEGLIERSLAHWIADQAGPAGAVILVPPDRTTSWCFHGGFRGLGSASWENRDGLLATVRIATATTADEAQALIAQHGVTHIILPSWDNDLDAFARWRLPNPEDGFVMALHHWALPPWLRPLPYHLPAVAGFERQSVVILKVTDESNRAAALARLAEYFLEMQQPELAAPAREALRRYPADLGALVALVQIEKTQGDTDAYSKAFNAIVASLASGFDRTLPWDRRVSLAVVLAQGERNDLARDQVRHCLEKLDETRIRSLTTAALFRLQVLAKAFGLDIADPRMRELAGKLLPPELRSRIGS